MLNAPSWAVLGWISVFLNVILLASNGAGRFFLHGPDWWYQDNVRVSNTRWFSYAGRSDNAGSLTLFAFDEQNQPNGILDVGKYNFGWTLMTDGRIEFHPTEEVSISSKGRLPRFQVRNREDTEGAVWINGENVIGSQFGPLRFAYGSFNESWKEIARFDHTGNFIAHQDIFIGPRSIGQELDRIAARLATLESTHAP